MNIFEGARRVAWVVQGLAAAVGVAILIYPSTYVRIIYEVKSPSGLAFYTTDDCSYLDKSHYVERRSEPGLSLLICFRGQKFPNGQTLIPYRQEGDTVYGLASYDDKVGEYVARKSKEIVSNHFFELELKEIYEREFRKQRIDTYISTVKGIFLFMFYFWLSTKIMGWVVRGFMGIPNGQDRVPPASSTPG